jgi:hypothetical protein
MVTTIAPCAWLPPHRCAAVTGSTKAMETTLSLVIVRSDWTPPILISPAMTWISTGRLTSVVGPRRCNHCPRSASTASYSVA